MAKFNVTDQVRFNAFVYLGYVGEKDVVEPRDVDDFVIQEVGVIKGKDKIFEYAQLGSVVLSYKFNKGKKK